MLRTYLTSERVGEKRDRLLRERERERDRARRIERERERERWKEYDIFSVRVRECGRKEIGY